MDTTETVSFCCLLGQLKEHPCLFSFFLFNDYRIVSHSSFACKWQNKSQDNELVVALFSRNKGETSNIRIPRSSTELHPTPCMRIVCRVRKLDSNHTSKQNVLSLILFIPLVKLRNQKRGICRHRILYPLRLKPPFPNDAQTLRYKASLEPNQISN